MRTIEIARPPLPNPPLTGRCHCGEVRYALDALPLAVNACHCRDCQRLAGAPFAVYLHATRGSRRKEGGALDVFRRRGGSGGYIHVSRCRACGTRMWHEPEAAPDLVIVCAATLDEPGWVVPTSHIFVAEAAPDSVAAADAATFAGAAIPGRQALWDRFADIYGRRPAAP